MRLFPFGAVVAFFLVGACSEASPELDGGVLQRSPIPVRVVSWNLRQFGLDGGSAERAAAVLSALSPDVIAVQEVVTEEAFADLTSRLSAFQSTLGPLSATAGGIRQGWLWKSARIDVHDSTALFTTDGLNFPRSPLECTIDVRADGGVAASFTAIAVHLKAGAREQDEARRVQALATLETHISAAVDAPAGENEVLLLGDYNEDFRDPRFVEAFAPFTQSSSRYRFLTLPFADAGTATYLPRRLFFDHMITTAALDDELDGGVPHVPALDAEQADFMSAVSDHLPVVIDLNF